MGQKFGQHFLSDTRVLFAIAETVSWLQQELWVSQLIEIGPGQWVLTKLIIDDFETVRLLEIDKALELYLEPLVWWHTDADIIWGDVLKCKDIGIDISNTLVVGNLPYYITSPIFRKFFCVQEKIAYWLQVPLSMWEYPGGVFLIQKEVAEKIKTITKQKSYLRWLLNYAYDIELNFIVPAIAFDPPPKVQSAVVSFRRNSPPNPLSLKGGERPDFTRMVEFLDIVSQFTRKTLRKIWKMRADDLASFILPPELEGKRVQELDWEELSQILDE